MFFNTRLALLRGARTLNHSISPIVTRSLAVSIPKQAGFSYLRTSLPQTVGDGWHAHGELKIMFSGLLIVLFANFMCWVHSSGDPRYYFGADQANNRWKKYMTEKQWSQPSGLGVSMFEASGNTLIYGEAGNPAYDSKLVDFSVYGWKQAWRRDLFRLIVDIESYQPKHYCPSHPLPLGGCACGCNKDSALTKLLQFEGKPLQWCAYLKDHEKPGHH